MSKPTHILGSLFRYVFVLYKQSREIDFGQPLASPCHDLAARTFSTADFYARHQDDLVPSGMAFFQSDYDSGVREVGDKLFY